jgi:hypothetical protein
MNHRSIALSLKSECESSDGGCLSLLRWVTHPFVFPFAFDYLILGFTILFFPVIIGDYFVRTKFAMMKEISTSMIILTCD